MKNIKKWRNLNYSNSLDDDLLEGGMDVFQKLWERFEYAHPVVRAILLIVIMLLLMAIVVGIIYMRV